MSSLPTNQSSQGCQQNAVKSKESTHEARLHCLCWRDENMAWVFDIDSVNAKFVTNGWQGQKGTPPTKTCNW